MTTRLVYLAALVVLGTGCIDTSGLVFGGEGGSGAGAGGGGAGVPGGTYASEVLADDPLAYWPLDDFIGIETEDLSGNGHTAQIGASGVVETDLAGHVGQAVRLTEAGTLFTGVPHPFGFGDGAYTLEAWVRVEGSDVQAGLWTCTDSGQPGYNTYLGSDSLNHKRYDGVDNESVEATSVTLSSFLHIAFVFDGSMGRWYFDGGLAAPATALALSWSEPPLAFQLARGPFDASGMVYLDEVAVYDHALSRERLLAHCQASPACQNQ